MSSINYISSNINIIDYYSRINSNLDTTFYNICNDYSNLNITDLTIYLNYIKLKRIQGNNNDIYINNFINSNPSNSNPSNSNPSNSNPSNISLNRYKGEAGGGKKRSNRQKIDE